MDARVKAFRKLVEIAEDFVNGKISKVEDIVDRYGMSFRTAYDYWNTILALREIFAEDFDEKIRELREKLRDISFKVEEIRSKELEKEITKIKAGLDKILAERKRRLGY